MTTLTKFPRISYSPGTPYVPATPGVAAAPGYYKTVLTPTTYPVYQWVWDGDFATFKKVGYTTDIIKTTVWVPPVAYRAPTPAVAAQPGVWSDLGVGWNSGADTIAGASGDTNFTFSIPAATVGVVVGISGSSANGDYRTILHGVYASHGMLSIVESGVVVPYPVPYSEGDRIGIQRLGSVVTYTKNATPLGTSAAATTGPVFGTAALYMAGDSVVDAAFGAVGGISANSMLPLTAQAFSGAYSQSINTLLPLATTATGRRLDGSQAEMEPLFSVGSNRPSGYSFAALSAMTSTASGRQYVARSAASFEPMQSMAADRPYGQSAASMLPASGLSMTGMFAPSYGASYASMAYLTNAAHGLTGEVGQANVVMLPMKSISSDHPYGASETALEPMIGLSGVFVLASTLEITGPSPTLYATGHDSTGEQAANLSAPRPTLSAFGGANARLSGPSQALAITATVTNWGQAALTGPEPALSASGTVASMAGAALTAPSPNLIGYSGAVCSITLTGHPTLQASGTTGGTGGAALTCPLFELSAGATAQNHGSASLLAPSPRLGATAQAWLVAPGATLTAIGSAVVAATYEAYAINLNHNDPASHDEVTRYTNFPFTQIVRYQGSYFGVAADGLYLLEGTTDDGEAIPWAFKTAMTDFKSPALKTVVSAYLGGRLGPVATIDLHVGEDGATSYNYATVRSDHAQTYRQKFGRGLKSRYYALGASGAGTMELDNIEFDTLNSNRRI